MRTRTDLHGWGWSLCFIFSLIAGNLFGGGTWNLYDDFNSGSTVNSSKWSKMTLGGGPSIAPTVVGQKMVFDLTQAQGTVMRTQDAVSGISGELTLSGDSVTWCGRGGLALITNKYRAMIMLRIEQQKVSMNFSIGDLAADKSVLDLELPADRGVAYDLGIFHDGKDFWLLYQNRIVATTSGRVNLAASTPTDTWAIALSDGGSGSLELTVDDVELFETTSPPISFSASSTTIQVPEGGSVDFTVELAAPQAAPVTITPYAVMHGESDLTISTAETIAAGNTQATFTLSAAEDSDWANGTTTFELHLSDDSRVLVTAVEADDEHHHDWSTYDNFDGSSLDGTKWSFDPDGTPFSLDAVNDRMVISSSPFEFNQAFLKSTTGVCGMRGNISFSQTAAGNDNAQLWLGLSTSTHNASVAIRSDGGGPELQVSIYTSSNPRVGCAVTIGASLDQVYDVQIIFDGTDFWIEVNGTPLIDSRCLGLSALALNDASFSVFAGNSGTYNGYVDSVKVYQFQPPSATLSAETPTNSQPITVTALFNEPVNGFTDHLTDITVAGGSASAITPVTASQYTFEVTPAGEGDITVTIVADAATAVSDGRGNTASSTVITYDTTPPGPPNVAYISEDRGSSSTDGITCDQTLFFYGTADPDTTSVEVFLDGSTIGTTTDVNSNGDWIFNYTGTALTEGQYAVTAIATDGAGNVGSASPAYNIDIDLTPPTVAISTAAVEPVTEVFSVTADFDCTVSGLTDTGITVSNGTVMNVVKVSPTQYTFDVKPRRDGSVSVNIAVGAAQDISGNGNDQASNTLTLVSDVPMIFIPQSDDGGGCRMGGRGGNSLLSLLLLVSVSVIASRFVMSRKGNHRRSIAKSVMFCTLVIGLAHLQVGGCGSDDGGGGGYFGGFRPKNAAPELVEPTSLSCAIVNDLVSLLPVSATYIDSDGTVTSLVFVTGADGVADPNAVIGQVDAPVDGQGTVLFDPSGHDKTTVEIYAMATDNKGASSGYDKIAVYTIDSDCVGPVIPATTKPLHDWSLVDIIVSPDGNTIDFGTPSAEVLDLVTGDVAVLFSCPAFPQGGLKKVLTITDMGSSLEIVFEPATLEQAVTDADMRVLYSMTPSDAEPIEQIDPAVSINCQLAETAAALAATVKQPLIAPAQTADSFVVSLNGVVVYDQDGNLSTTNDQITATGSLTLTPVLDLSATFRSSAMTAAYSVVTLERDVQLTVSAGVTVTPVFIPKLLVTIPMKDVVYMIGWIPVYIEVNVPVALLVDGNIKPGLTSAVTLSSSTEAGVSYVDGVGWQTVSSRTTTEDVIEATADSTGDIGAHIGPLVYASLYATDGPNAALYAKTRFDANLAADPQWSLYAGVMAQAAFETEIFSKTVAPYDIAMVHDWETFVADGPRIPDLAVIGGEGANDMTWTTRTDESYDVYWSTSPGVTTLSNKLTDAVPGTHTGLNDNTTYYYRARSRKYGSISSLSAEVSATTKKVWPVTFGGSIVPGPSIDVDSLGNVYVAGSFGGTVDFDPGTGTDNRTSNGGNDAFITKINASGSHAWTKTFGGTGDDFAFELDLDSDGNIFVVGSFRGTVDFNPGTGTDSHTANGLDAYVMKVNADGSYGWTKTFGGTSSGNEWAYGVDSDSDGNIFVAGHFSDTVDFDSGTGTDNHTSNGGSDAFITKINANGSYGWTKTIGGTLDDSGYDIALNNGGDIFVGGTFQDTVDFNPGWRTDNHTSTGGSDAFVMKLNANGSYGWTKTVGGIGGERADSLALDSSGNIFVTGQFSDTVDFNFGTGTDNHAHNGDGDVFVMKINANGSYGWTKTFGGRLVESVDDIALSNGGNIYLMGAFRSTVDFDPGPGTDIHMPHIVDFFVVKLNANGSYGWTKTVGGNGWRFKGSLAPDSSGNVFVTGSFMDTADLDPGPGTDYHTAPDGAIFVLKLAP